MTHKGVIALFEAGRYYVDPETGIIYSGRTNQPIYTCTGFKDRKNKWCRLFAYSRSRAMPVAHCVWLWMTREPIPPNFQIHHRNVDGTDDRWLNLFCLHRLDHSKLHTAGPAVLAGDLLNNTPF